MKFPTVCRSIILSWKSTSMYWLTGILLLGAAQAQTIFSIRQLPINTPDPIAIYVCGTFNGWETSDPDYLLKLQPDGSYALSVENLNPPFEYKFTRGDWTTVESDSVGLNISNRIQPPGGSGVIQVKIAGWVDMPPPVVRDSLTIVLTRIPENTPLDARIYIAGNFNSWRTNDDRYLIQQDEEGVYSVDIPIFHEILEFKFTRGSWENVEGRASGRARFNRKLDVSSLNPLKPVGVQIESWEDLSGTPINGYTVFWLMAAILCLLLILAINTLEDRRTTANALLSALLLMLSVTLISRVVIYDREIFQAEPKLLLIPDLIYFLYAPVFLLYIQRLLRPSPTAFDARLLLQFVPFFLHIAAYMPLFFLEDSIFMNRAVVLDLRMTFVYAGGLALPFNIGYWAYARRLIKEYQYESDHQHSAGSNLQFLRNIINLKGLCLLIWAGSYLIGIYGWATGTDTTHITDRMTDGLWLGFATTAFMLGYYALKEPDIFKLPNSSPPAPDMPIALQAGPETLAELPEGTPPPEPETPELDAELMENLDNCMKDEHPYLNPKLTLPELAEQVGTNPHELSRTINQGYGMNFNDYVNSHRIEAFKTQVLEPTYRNHTFLAVAMMVGFNSKTAFNRSFKKLTGQTPREYFRAELERREADRA